MKERQLAFGDIIIATLGFSLGGWLLLDGTLKLATGLYTGEDTIGIGPWAAIVSLLGIKPEDMAIPFILLGILWVVNSILVIAATPSRFERTILSGVLTLFYLIPGTIIGVVVIVLSVRRRRRIIDNGGPDHL